MTKHTPGPWICSHFMVCSVDDSIHHAVVSAEDGTLLHFSAVMNDQNKANVRLIAAAPELLTELRRLIRYVEASCIASDDRNTTLDLARAAIAKATP